jgi:hypothetical protein
MRCQGGVTAVVDGRPSKGELRHFIGEMGGEWNRPTFIQEEGERSCDVPPLNKDGQS